MTKWHLESDLGTVLAAVVLHRSLLAFLEQGNRLFLALTLSSGARVLRTTDLALQGPAGLRSGEIR